MSPTLSLRRRLLLMSLALGALAARGDGNLLTADEARSARARQAGVQDSNPSVHRTKEAIDAGDPRPSSGDADKRVAGSQASVSSALNVNRWAIVVGISKYQYEKWNLKYADRDARELYTLLQTPMGGAFDKANIVYLENDKATTKNITRALRTFLKKPAREDVVLLYFACHGTPDPERPDVVYLLTHDTDPDDISGTALPMREIQTCLRDYSNAERTVILADTCHSAAISGQGRRNVGAVNTAMAVNNYLQQVSRSKEGTALLTSAEANETSLEDEKWGGGHGVFTHYLLEGMRGKADLQEPDGIVTTGELFEYVRNQVIQQTDSKQHPTIGTSLYDRHFPMAITGGISAQNHFDLGQRLHYLGWVLRDKRFFRSAALHLSIAQSLYGAGNSTEAQARANRLCGLSLIAAGEHGNAIRPLEKAIALDREKEFEDNDFYLGICYVRQGSWQDAEVRLKSFLAKAPEDEKVPVARQLLSELGPPEKTHALFIGIDQYAHKGIPSLRGSVSDAVTVRRSLLERFGLELKSDITLLDKEASREKIQAAIKRIAAQVSPGDVLLVFFSGHAANRDDFYLLVHDTVLNDISRTAISLTDLGNTLNALPASANLILDTTGLGSDTQFLQKTSRDCRFNVLIAALPDSNAVEIQRLGHGLFSYALADVLGANHRTMRYLELLRRTDGRMQTIDHSYQHPFLVGDPLQHFLSRRSFLHDFDYSLMEDYFALTAQELDNFSRPTSRAFPIECADLNTQLGIEMLEKGLNSGALSTLQAASGRLRVHGMELLRHLAVAELRTGRYEAAAESLNEYATVAMPSQTKAAIKESIASVNQLKQGRKHALLVGIDDYEEAGIKKPRGAVNDVQALKRALVQKLGFLESDIVILLDRAATKEKILQEFQVLAKKAVGNPALFYFAGVGSRKKDDSPTLVSADGRTKKVYDIEIAELARAAGDSPTNLVAILDAGWVKSDTLADVGRFVEPDNRPPLPSGGGRNLRPLTRDAMLDKFIGVGRHCVYSFFLLSYKNQSTLAKNAGSIELMFPPLMGEVSGKHHGRLTVALIEALSGDDLSSLTFGKWMDRVHSQLGEFGPLIKSVNLDEVVFSNAVAVSTIEKNLGRISRAPAREAIVLLRLLIDQRPDLAVGANIDLGIACAAVEQYNESIAALETALELAKVKSGPELVDARACLGRVFSESGTDLSRAVSELRQAVALRPDDGRLRYDLAQSIRKLVEQGLLAEVERNLRSYQEMGSPLGHVEEVQTFLESRPGIR